MSRKNEYTATAGQTDFIITFPYIEDSNGIIQIQLYRDGVSTGDKGGGGAAGWEFIDSTTIRLNVPASVGEIILFKRETTVTPIVTWAVGSKITKSDLDILNKQCLYIAEEAADDAATYSEEVESILDDAQASADAALVSEIAAASSEAAALTSEVNAANSETNAASSETNAAASEAAVLGVVNGVVVDTFIDGVDYTSGTTTQLTLSTTPIGTNSVIVIFDGGVKHSTEWSVNTTTITFTSAIPLGINAIQVYIFPPLYDVIGTIQSSILTAKDSVAEMEADSTLAVGYKVITAAFYSTLAGGSALYEIVAAGTDPSPNGITYINLSGSGLQAKLLHSGTIYSKQAGIKHDGTTDNTTRIQALYATGLSVIWDEGTVGAIGPLSCAFVGQVIRGTASTGSPIYRGGTIFKRLSGTADPFISFVGDDGALANITVDNNFAVARAFFNSAHGIDVRNINVVNADTTGTKYAVELNSINTSSYTRLICETLSLTNNSLYTSFRDCHVIGGLPMPSLNMTDVEKITFYSLILNNASSGPSLYFNGGYAININFYGTRGEHGGLVTPAPLADSFIKALSGGTYRHITFNDLEWSPALVGSFPIFELEDVLNFKLDTAYLPDNTSAAGTNVIVLKGCDNATIKNVTTNWSNNHNVINMATQCNNFVFENINAGPRSGIGSILLRSIQGSIKNCDSNISGAGATDHISMRNCTGTIDLTNITQADLINCSAPTNPNITTTQVLNGYSVLGAGSVASSATLSVPSGEVVTVTGTTNITGGIASGSTIIGRTLRLLFSGTLQVSTGGNLKLNVSAGAFNATPGGVLVITCHSDGNWYEESRSQN